MDIRKGRLQMINWSFLPPGKSFSAHYHEDMDEIFIIISGKAEIHVGEEKTILKKGDAVIIPAKAVHVMEALSGKAVEYIALGISQEKSGKTIVT
ncbi:MAG: cupin domain-containing protein [Patescibacteria group bacterium]|jgi:mannose-6-phosphate isomerase-like protein (cupin superfamily)